MLLHFVNVFHHTQITQWLHIKTLSKISKVYQKHKRFNENDNEKFTSILFHFFFLSFFLIYDDNFKMNKKDVKEKKGVKELFKRQTERKK